MQVRRRDKSKKVIVEEKRYESVDPGSKSGLPDLDSGVLDTFQPDSDFGSSSLSSDSSDEFSWVQRLQNVPDKVCLNKYNT